MKFKKKCPICGFDNFTQKFTYNKKPRGETKFEINYKNYFRYYLSCNSCGHWFSKNNLIPKNIYSSNYNKYTYSKNIKKNFLKIIKLPKKKSDNYLRLKRIKDFINKYKKKKKIELLDVGSGLGVFPYSIKNAGWNCTALDPDIISVRHIKNKLKIKCIHGDFIKKSIAKRFDIVTFNKVLEHVKNPLKMLKKAKKNLNKNGIAYLEVPDAEAASKHGKEREEFFIDHMHVFTKKSLELLSIKSKFELIKIDRTVEPSGKFTIFAFVKRKN